MKKYFIACAVLCATLVITSCGSSKESAYRKAYEKARAQEQQQTIQEQPQTQQPQEQQPVVVERPVTETKTVDNYDNVAVRQESVNVVSGDGIKGYNVIVGSFGLKANAEALQGRLKSNGYNAQIVFNGSNNMYRVVAATFDNKGEAVQSRDKLRSQFPDAWLLFKK